jgi:hypothetical protein
LMVWYCLMFWWCGTAWCFDGVALPSSCLLSGCFWMWLLHGVIFVYYGMTLSKIWYWVILWLSHISLLILLRMWSVSVLIICFCLFVMCSIRFVFFFVAP